MKRRHRNQRDGMSRLRAMRLRVLYYQHLESGVLVSYFYTNRKYAKGCEGLSLVGLKRLWRFLVTPGKEYRDVADNSLRSREE